VVVIGVTGGIGGGKSALSSAFCDALPVAFPDKRLVCRIIDADMVYRELTRTCTPMLLEIRGSFGGGVFTKEGELDRRALGSVVFNDELALLDLERITHRYVIEEVEKVLSKCDADIVILEAIALFESGADKLCSCTVAVAAAPETRIARVMQRDKMSREAALLRISSQKPDEYYFSKSDYDFENNESGELTSRAAALLEQIFYDLCK